MNNIAVIVTFECRILVIMNCGPTHSNRLLIKVVSRISDSNTGIAGAGLVPKSVDLPLFYFHIYLFQIHANFGMNTFSLFF